MGKQHNLTICAFDLYKWNCLLFLIQRVGLRHILEGNYILFGYVKVVQWFSVDFEMPKKNNILYNSLYFVLPGLKIVRFYEMYSGLPSLSIVNLCVFKINSYTGIHIYLVWCFFYYFLFSVHHTIYSQMETFKKTFYLIFLFFLFFTSVYCDYTLIPFIYNMYQQMYINTVMLSQNKAKKDVIPCTRVEFYVYFVTSFAQQSCKDKMRMKRRNIQFCFQVESKLERYYQVY